jgi:hypothetical protein
LLVGDPQPFAAGDQDSHGRRVSQDGLNQIGSSVEDVLAVVEQQQPDPAIQRSGDRLTHALSRLLIYAQHSRHRIGHRRGISHSGQFEKPDAVGEFIRKTSCDLQG